jgi:putative transposase
MYDYRRMTPDERRRVLEERRGYGYPLHAPPHFDSGAGRYLITAACYEHQPIFADPGDLSVLCRDFLTGLRDRGVKVGAWVFLPNHYHLLLEAKSLASVSETLRRLHSRTATRINGRQGKHGRVVWYRFSDRRIRGERHYHASVVYVILNPVKHGYVDRAEQWPWSSVHEFLGTQGEEGLKRSLDSYPVEKYGTGWDD